MRARTGRGEPVGVSGSGSSRSSGRRGTTGFASHFGERAHRSTVDSPLRAKRGLFRWPAWQARPMDGLLRQRNFRLLWLGRTTSRFGSNISAVALPLVAVVVLHANAFTAGLLAAAACSRGCCSAFRRVRGPTASPGGRSWWPAISQQPC
ncbi:hypothetical protein LWP59_22225 [Amycolatopsis acidiphila]|uniref:hypothetical protein n=1 Tax=Amycolatopsis acidiphila TaxID=715473 RepID=UPI001643E58C|nr:hypothetical protein [Amycolatopsis acidiphila]UIJ56885.1 hypothetical protein LWP59_22225 [Amycolatopsis acidiphila]